MANYIDWNPIKDDYEELFFLKLEYEYNYLIVSLKELAGNQRVLQIKFSGVMGYRVFQEGSRQKTINENLTYRGFKMTTDSEFINWFKEESYGIFDDWDLKHYIITNINNVIDVICGTNIELKWINE